jgi:hypothetical protein
MLTVSYKVRSQTPCWAQKTKCADNNADKHRRHPKMHHIAPKETNADLRVSSIIASRLALQIATSHERNKVQATQREKGGYKREAVSTQIPKYQNRVRCVGGRHIVRRQWKCPASSVYESGHQASFKSFGEREEGVGRCTYISMCCSDMTGCEGLPADSSPVTGVY